MIKKIDSADMKKLFIILNKLQRLLAGSNPRSGHKVICYQEEGVQEKTSSGVNSENVATLVDEIVRLLEEQQIFKSPELDLKRLSERLKTPAYLVTRAINEGLGVNFNDLINRYRVEEVKSLLKADHCKRFTLLAVAFDAGFSSKTTFNTVFKKMTGLTPSSYRDQHCLDAASARNQSSGDIKRTKAIKVGQLAIES